MSDIISFLNVTAQDKKFHAVVSKFAVLNLKNKFRVCHEDGSFQLQATRTHGRIYYNVKEFKCLKDAQDYIFTEESADALEAIE